VTTLTASNTFTIADAATVTESVAIPVLPAIVAGSGKGRLVHPTLGTYDYDIPPTAWRNIDSDAIIRPVWQSTMTLGGFANTLWAGTLRDVEVQEIWGNEGGLSMRLPQLRMMLAFWQKPPDPPANYVLWYPNYISTLGFKVIMTGVSTSGNEVELDVFSRSGLVSNAVTLTMRITGRAP
jgi:hypothetical protein